jgi:hypothetical protein
MMLGARRWLAVAVGAILVAGMVWGLTFAPLDPNELPLLWWLFVAPGCWIVRSLPDSMVKGGISGFSHACIIANVIFWGVLAFVVFAVLSGRRVRTHETKTPA